MLDAAEAVSLDLRSAAAIAMRSKRCAFTYLKYRLDTARDTQRERLQAPAEQS